MKNIKFTLFCFLTIVCGLASGDGFLGAKNKKTKKVNIALVKSADLQKYNQVALGVKNHLASQDYDLNIISIGKGFGKKQVNNFIKKKKIKLVIALGTNAAVLFSNAKERIPVVFGMVFNYKRLKELNRRHVTGVSMELSSENLFTQFRFVHSGLRRLALPYNPNASQEVVNEARGAASLNGIQLVPLPLSKARLLSKSLSDNEDKFDSIWMIHDSEIYNKKVLKEVRKLFSFAKKKNKPIFVSSEAFLKVGGLFSVSIDYLSLGSQLALLTNRIIKNKESVRTIRITSPIGTKTVLNMKVARLFLDKGILDETILEYPVDIILE